MTRAAAGQAATIYGDGGQSRDFVYVKDVVRANWLAATKAAASGRVFNVGTGSCICIRDLWDLICDLSRVQLDPVFAPPRPGDIRESVSDISEIDNALGFRPQVDLRRGLEDTLAWYRAAG
jgi:nucleoside-diphosphate-sugar epimerase